MKRYLIIFILIALIVGQYFQGKKSDSRHLSNIEALNSELSIYKTKNGELVASKKSLIVSESTLKSVNDSLSEIIDNFKDPDVIIKYKWKIRVDTIKIPIKETAEPGLFAFDNEDKWLRLSGFVGDGDIIFNPPIMNNEQSIVAGDKRMGWFKKKEYFVDIKNTNPYVHSESMTTFKVEIKKSPLEKWWITVPAGILVGAITFD